MAEHGVGFEYPPQEVSWLQRDVLLFANSIGCTTEELHFLFVWPFSPVIDALRSAELTPLYRNFTLTSPPSLPIPWCWVRLDCPSSLRYNVKAVVLLTNPAQ